MAAINAINATHWFGSYHLHAPSPRAALSLPLMPSSLVTRRRRADAQQAADVNMSLRNIPYACRARFARHYHTTFNTRY